VLGGGTEEPSVDGVESMIVVGTVSGVLGGGGITSTLAGGSDTTGAPSEGKGGSTAGSGKVAISLGSWPDEVLD
jgi:hypothetical protein